jgi:hypothetical protein
VNFYDEHMARIAAAVDPRAATCGTLAEIRRRLAGQSEE